METILVILLVVVAAVFSYSRGFAKGREVGTDKGIGLGRVMQTAINDTEWAMKQAHASIRDDFEDELDEEEYAREFQRRLEANLEIRQRAFVQNLLGGQDNESD